MPVDNNDVCLRPNIDVMPNDQPTSQEGDFSEVAEQGFDNNDVHLRPYTDVIPTDNEPLLETKLPIATGSKFSKKTQTLKKKPIKRRSTNNKQIKLSKNKKGKRPPQFWKHGNLVLDEEETGFRGNFDLPRALADLQHPYQFFKYFVDDELISNIATQSLLYSTQQKNLY